MVWPYDFIARPPKIETGNRGYRIRSNFGSIRCSPIACSAKLRQGLVMSTIESLQVAHAKHIEAEDNNFKECRLKVRKAENERVYGERELQRRRMRSNRSRLESMIQVQDAVTKMRHMCRLMDVYCQQSDELKEGVGRAVTHREFVQQARDVSSGSMVAEEVLKDATFRVSKATGEVDRLGTVIDKLFCDIIVQAKAIHDENVAFIRWA